MLISHEILPDFYDYHELLNYSKSDCLFFDIETTGLSHTSSAVFLIGAVRRTPDGWTLTQYFAEHTDEESELLSRFLSDLGTVRTLIHFNGTTFDIPYLRDKAEHYHLAFPSLESVDLYQRFRPLKKLLSLSRMNQQSLEPLAGYHRKDELTGKHMIALFHGYEKTQDPALRALLLLHNHDDLVGMTQLLSFASYEALQNGSFQICSMEEPKCLLSDADRLSCNSTADAVSDGVFDGTVSADTVSGSAADGVSYGAAGSFGERFAWSIRFHLDAPVPIPLHMELTHTAKHVSQDGFPSESPASCGTAELPSYHLQLSGSEGCLTLFGRHRELKYFFQDYRSYYYLPLEDQAIHKSVAAFVEKEYRTPASRENCYIKKNGLFFPQPSNVIQPVFLDRFDAKTPYFEYTEELAQDMTQLKALMLQILGKL